MMPSYTHNRSIDYVSGSITSCYAQVCIADIRAATPWSSALQALGWTTHVTTVRDWITADRRDSTAVDARLIDIRPLRDARLQYLVAERLAADATPTLLLGDPSRDQEMARRLHALALIPPTFALNDLEAALEQARTLITRPRVSQAAMLPRC